MLRMIARNCGFCARRRFNRLRPFSSGMAMSITATLTSPRSNAGRRRRAAVLPHHVEIVLEVEQLRKAGAHHHMVIHQYHTDHFSHSVAESWPYDACRRGAGNQPSAVMQSV